MSRRVAPGQSRTLGIRRLAAQNLATACRHTEWQATPIPDPLPAIHQPVIRQQLHNNAHGAQIGVRASREFGRRRGRLVAELPQRT